MADFPWRHLGTRYGLMVTGEKVTASQAADILLRTDPYLTCLAPDDAHPNLQAYCEAAGLRAVLTSQHPSFVHQKQQSTEDKESNKNTTELRSKTASTASTASTTTASTASTTTQDAISLQSHLQILRLRCLDNAWSYSDNIEGLYGWVSPSGVVFMERDVVVAHPLQVLYDEVRQLAAAFPFLCASVTLFDASWKADDAQVMVSYMIHKGKAKLSESSVYKLHGRKRVRQELSVDTVRAANRPDDVVPCALELDFLFAVACFVRKQWEKLS
jgi:hypothetical protein